jgi:3-methylfumaryl-CoA hydratase
MSAGCPREFADVVSGWRPAPQVVHGELSPWPAQALAALLGALPPGPRDPLPPLWHEVYLHQPYAVTDLGPEGHLAEGGLLPPLAERRRMFGGGRITVEQPLRVGEVATRTSTVIRPRVREGRSGWLLLLTELHEITVGGAPRVTDERDIVYRVPADVSRAAVPPPAATGPAAPQPAPPAPAFGLDVDERVLFMFSALTYNAHRIHYDRRYTVDVEGHRDLLVHGPLLAIGAVEAARRTGTGDISAFSYRLVSPSYPGTPISFGVERADPRQATVTGTQDGVVRVEARVTWRA